MNICLVKSRGVQLFSDPHPAADDTNVNTHQHDERLNWSTKVPKGGVEPPRSFGTVDFESTASAIPPLGLGHPTWEDEPTYILPYRPVSCLLSAKGERICLVNENETDALRVLVAEDEALIRLDLVELLQEAGYTVVGQAGDGEEAVALARELDPDVVVMDVKMPKMDGITAAETITEERIAPVVILTAFSQRDLIDRASRAGAMAYVIKPFDASDVIPAIEMARARFAQIVAVEAEVADLEERLASRKIVDQAKALLQEGLGLTEAEAFRWIQKTAMDLRKSMREVAQGVIDHGRPAKGTK